MSVIEPKTAVERVAWALDVIRHPGEHPAGRCLVAGQEIREIAAEADQLAGAVASLAVIRGALDDLEHAPFRAQALADLPDIIRAAIGPSRVFPARSAA
jgi:hypothetical protein